MPTRIAFATSRKYPYLTAEDLLAVKHLEAAGIKVEALIWDQMDEDFERFQAIVVRSCWDYHLKAAEFSNWTRRVESSKVSLLNSPETIRWNMNKSYLRELEAQGVEIPRTVWIEKGGPRELSALLETHAFREAVVKPVVSLSAYNTWKITAETAAARQTVFDEALAGGEMMLQEYVPGITTGGELSFIFFQDEFAYAVRKFPAPGDFRVQSEYGALHRYFEPSVRMIRDAKRILALAKQPTTTYARVDVLEEGDRLLLMELELIDPSLYLEQWTEAPKRFADSIRATLSS